MPYQMPNGKWRGTRMIDGKVKTRSFATKAEAKKWEAEQTAEKWEAAENLPIPSICWLDFATAYLRMAEERFSKKTLAEKKLAFRHSLKVIKPEQPAKDVSVSQALAALREVARTSSGNAANKMRKNLAAAWGWGHKYYELPTPNPFLETDKFPADQCPRYVPPEGDFWKVYAAAEERDQAFLLFLLHTGARVGEVFRLTWTDIDLAGGRVRLGTRKTSDGGMKYAWLPMTEMLASVLTDYKRKYGNTPLEQFDFKFIHSHTIRTSLLHRLV